MFLLHSKELPAWRNPHIKSIHDILIVISICKHKIPSFVKFCYFHSRIIFRFFSKWSPHNITTVHKCEFVSKSAIINLHVLHVEYYSALFTAAILMFGILMLTMDFQIEDTVSMSPIFWPWNTFLWDLCGNFHTRVIFGNLCWPIRNVCCELFKRKFMPHLVSALQQKVNVDLIQCLDLSPKS